MTHSALPKFAMAAVLRDINSPLMVEEIEIPNLLPGQVLVKIFFSGVCRSQLMEVRGGRGFDSWLPHLLGHEGSGVVLSVGKGVTKVIPGDEVILGWIKGVGMDAPGAVYRCGNQLINSGRVTTFSNYTIVSESRLTKKPPLLPADAAVLYGCALPTGAGMVLNQIRPTANQQVVILGLGGIGLSALLATVALGIKNIIAIDISDEKLQLAKKLGATILFNSTTPNLKEILKAVTNGGADICVESGGTTESIELGFALLNKQGRLIFASHPPGDEMIRILPHDLISGKKIEGSWGGGSSPDRDIPKIYRILERTNVHYSLLLTKKYTLFQINDALNDLESGSVFRPLVVMEH